MPSKSFIESANRFLAMRRAPEFGLSTGHLAYSSDAIIARKSGFVAEFSQHRMEQLSDGRFQFLRGWAEFTDPHHLKVKLKGGGETEIEGRFFMIATGSVVNVVPLDGLRETGYLDSDIALNANGFPKSVVILGGGAIALEFAHFYSGLGLEVTLLQRSSQIIKEADADVAEALVTAFQKRGIKIFCGTKLTRVERSANGKRVWYVRDGKEKMAEADEIFYALGRKPAVQRLSLEKARVETDKRSAVLVNEMLQTSQPHIFAGGDVTGLYEIVHIGIQQGEIAARNAKNLVEGKALSPIDYRLKMFVMFTEPQMAVVGISEREASEQGRKVVVAKHPFHDHGKSIIRGELDGFVKLIVDAKNGEIVGGAVIGPEASELIHEIAVAMQFRATAAQLALVPHYHPTLSEIWTYPAEELAQVGARSR